MRFAASSSVSSLAPGGERGEASTVRETLRLAKEVCLPSWPRARSSAAILRRYRPCMPPSPRYREIAADLRRRILAGEIPHGLPSERQLRSHYDTHQTTLRAALFIIEAEGLLVRQQGAIHQVRRKPERTLVDV